MQPCGVCGGTAVDASGFCVGCRAYRGLPGPEPASVYPTAYELIGPGAAAQDAEPTAPPYSSYGVDYQQPHTTPGPPPEPVPSRRRNQFVVPLVALSATLVVVIVAIVVVV